MLRSKSLLGILAFLKPYWVGTTLAITLLLFNIALELFLPRISGSAINQLRYAIATNTPYEPWGLAELFLAVAFERSCVAFCLGRIRNRLVQGTLKDIRAAYFDAVQGLSFTYHDKTNTGELISRGTADISRLQEFIFACLFLGIDISIAMIMTVVLITFISPLAGLATICTLGPTVGLIVYYARLLNPKWRKIQDLHGELTTVIQENIAGVRVVKAFAREPDEIAKFRERRDIFVGTVLETVNYWAGRVPMAQFIFGSEHAADSLDLRHAGDFRAFAGRKSRDDHLLPDGHRRAHGADRPVREHHPKRERECRARDGSARGAAEDVERHGRAFGQDGRGRAGRLRARLVSVPGRKRAGRAGRFVRRAAGTDHRHRWRDRRREEHAGPSHSPLLRSRFRRCAYQRHRCPANSSCAGCAGRSA